MLSVKEDMNIVFDVMPIFLWAVVVFGARNVLLIHKSVEDLGSEMRVHAIITIMCISLMSYN